MAAKPNRALVKKPSASVTATQIVPLRTMVLVCLEAVPLPTHGLQVIQADRAICRFRVLACGPDVRDVQPGHLVLANRLAGTVIGEHLLLPESAILATL